MLNSIENPSPHIHNSLLTWNHNSLWDLHYDTLVDILRSNIRDFMGLRSHFEHLRDTHPLADPFGVLQLILDSVHLGHLCRGGRECCCAHLALWNDLFRKTALIVSHRKVTQVRKQDNMTDRCVLTLSHVELVNTTCLLAHIIHLQLQHSTSQNKNLLSQHPGQYRGGWWEAGSKKWKTARDTIIWR